MKRVAIIDLGSNTSKLIVMAFEPNRQFRQVDELRQVVRLAQGMGDAKVIRKDAFERGLSALEAFKSYCDAAQIDEVCATATSAVRSAANGESFLSAVKRRVGLTLRVLSGEEEAAYGVVAVANSLSVTDALVLDIGGGSAQLSRMAARRFVSGKSWPVGAVRMTEAFLSADPPKSKEVKALQRHIAELLTDDTFVLKPGELLVGMGGTIRNLAKMQQRRENYPIDLLNSYLLRADVLAEITDDLLSKTVAEREAVAGLKRDRADIIAAGAVVAREVVAQSGASGIVVSTQGLREGLFYSYLQGDPPLIDNLRDFSVHNLARRYYDHAAHNEHVRTLSLALFDQLADLHGYGPPERELLGSAALLHDIGMAISYNDHHKHGFYLVMGADLPGFSHREQAVVALLVRYHRKGTPKAEGLDGVLDKDDMTRVAKLGALLRLAEYLERSKSQRVTGVYCHLAEGYVQIEAVSEGDARVEILEANLASDLLAEAYGVEVEVVAGHA